MEVALFEIVREEEDEGFAVLERLGHALSAGWLCWKVRSVRNGSTLTIEPWSGKTPFCQAHLQCMCRVTHQHQSISLICRQLRDGPSRPDSVDLYALNHLPYCRILPARVSSNELSLDVLPVDLAPVCTRRQLVCRPPHGFCARFGDDMGQVAFRLVRRRGAVAIAEEAVGAEDDAHFAWCNAGGGEKGGRYEAADADQTSADQELTLRS